MYDMGRPRWDTHVLFDMGFLYVLDRQRMARDLGRVSRPNSIGKQLVKIETRHF